MRADRLMRLLALLQRHRRATAGWLAGELEVSERTVLRDMEALSAAGVPVYTERGKGGGCVLLEDYTTRASGLTPRETQALFAWAGRESTSQLGLGGDLASALAKVAATAPSGALRDAEALGEVVLSDRRRWFAATDDVPLLPDLRRASSQRRRIRARYQSPDRGRSGIRTLHPVGLVDHSGRWYLVAEHRRRTRSYRVSRFGSVELLDQPVDLADDRPLTELWADLRRGLESVKENVEVTVSVERASAPRWRRLAAMQLVADEQIATTPDPDDPARERWRLTVRSPTPFAMLAVMAAPDVTVLEPRSMLTEVRAAAHRALAHYPDDPAGR